MIRALIAHAWRLLTFRHDGTGLPKSISFLVVMIIVSMGVAWVRWKLLPSGQTMLMYLSALLIEYLLIMYISSPAVGAAFGYALISISWDSMLILIGSFITVGAANTIGHLEFIFLGTFLYKLKWPKP